MKRKSCFIISVALLLAGCGGSQANFAYEPDSTLPTVFRNGDAITNVTMSSDFYASTRLAQSGEIVDRLNSGESLLLLWHQTTCQHCKNLREVFSPYIKDSKALCYSFDETNIVSGVNELKEAFPAMEEDFPTLATPYLFRLDAETKRASRIDFVGHTSTVSSFEGFMGDRLNLENIYTFRSFSNFERFCKDNSALGYVSTGTSLDEHFFESIYPKAKRSNKVTAILEIAYMSQSDSDSYASSFGRPSPAVIDYEKETPTPTKVGEAGPLIESYYAS